jgi:hypothetical protein
MGSNLQEYDAAVARCETIAGHRGHALSPWYPVDDRLHASLCEECGGMVWVSRPDPKKHWRSGGGALVQDCPEEWTGGYPPRHVYINAVVNDPD